jgi:hypothetical protein
MKRFFRVFGAIALAIVLGTGCEEKPLRSAPVSELTASDLAQLTDFHAWKTRVPEAQQPFKSIQLVVYKRGQNSTVSKHMIASDVGPVHCDTIVLGFRVEADHYVGKLFASDSKTGGGSGWGILFDDAFDKAHDDYFRAGWGNSGTLQWEGNRAPLAVLSGTNGDTVLAIELNK